MGDNNILEEVQKIYNDVSEWLKFLEAKHAALFAVWTALLIAVVTADFFVEAIILWKAVLVIPILVGSMINMISFIPFLNRCKFLRERCYQKYKTSTDNIVFYQAIFSKTYQSNNSEEDKYKELLEEYFEREIDDKLTKDYIKQIVEVSTVASIKAYLFSVAVKYTMAVSLLVIAGLIIA